MAVNFLIKNAYRIRDDKVAERGTSERWAGEGKEG